VADIVHEHWRGFGRNYYTRHDYEAVDTVEAADSFAYHDPVDGSESANQGLRVMFTDGSRAVLRLSGTGTEGATIRVYLERYEPAEGDLGVETQAALEPVAAAIDALSGLHALTGRAAPDVMT
jgi:phosphoglucomutase